MGIRRSYHFNTAGAGRLDGVYFNDPCDLHFRQFGVYTPAPYGIDSDASARLQIGDRVGSRPNSASLAIEFQGGIHQHAVSTNTSPYNVGIDDYIIFVDSTAGNITVNLPSIATFPRKILYIYKKVRANSVIITPNGGDTIEGFTGTQLQLSNPNYCLKLVADDSTNVWRQLSQAPKGLYLDHEYPVNPTVTISLNTFQVVRSFNTTILTNRDVAIIMSGSGWYNNAEFAIVEFAVFIDGVQGPLIAWWQNEAGTNHIPFAATGLFYNTAGSHTFDIRARIKTGSHNFTMDGNDFLNIDLIQY